MDEPLIDLVKKAQKPAPVLTPESLLGTLRRGPQTIGELAARFGCSTALIQDLLVAMRDDGANVLNLGDTWRVVHQPAPRATEFVYESRPDNTYRFGVASDQHLCSKYERLDVLNDLYDWFEQEGVDRVFNAGNWIDGDDIKNQHDVAVWGFEPQVDYCVAHYPQRRGIDTYAVWGEDHEGWYSRREAIDVGRFVERRFRDNGRTDWHDLGFMEAGITLVNGNSGAVAPPLVVMHPGGGSSYAVSYRPQKIVESLQGGEKPSVLLIGHYHKLSFNLFRSIWCIQCGCFTGNTSIETDQGAKKIRDIKVGDNVLTHTGKYRRVTETMKRRHTGDLVSVNYGRKGRPDQTLTATPEHPVRVRRDGQDVWTEIAEVRPGDGIHVVAAHCRCCGIPVPYWMKMCMNCNPMRVAATREKLAASKGGAKQYTRGESSGEVHLTRDIIPFCDRMVAKGWKMIPVGGGVIPDAIGVKNGKIVAFELERAGEYSRLRAHKEAKYEGAPVSRFVDEVRWVDLVAGVEQPRTPYEIDIDTGFVVVPVLSVKRKPARWGRGKTCSVYNFEVERDHSYVAGRVVVHNCSQDQTPFMRKKGLDAHMGGLIVTLRQDPETGAITGCDISTRQYFNKGYTNHRWSRSGPVVKAQKERIG